MAEGERWGIRKKIDRLAGGMICSDVRTEMARCHLELKRDAARIAGGMLFLVIKNLLLIVPI
jgi:hypothetical protein